MNNPKLYAKFEGLSRKDAILALENYFNYQKWNANEGLKILDIGFADGGITMDIIVPYMGKCLGELIGLDICKEMVQYANKNYQNPKVKFMQFDVSSPSIPNKFENQFNIIFSLYCLHLVPNQRKALDNIYKMLKPEGDILISMPNRCAVFESFEKLALDSKWSKYMKDYQNFISPYNRNQHPEETIRTIMEEIGFEVHQCNSERLECTFRGRAHLSGFISVCPFLSRIPKKDMNQYVEDFVEGIINSDTVQVGMFEDNEKIIMKYELLVISASKPKNVP